MNSVPVLPSGNNVSLARSPSPEKPTRPPPSFTQYEAGAARLNTPEQPFNLPRVRLDQPSGSRLRRYSGREPGRRL